jgi:hypothetical protein
LSATKKKRKKKKTAGAYLAFLSAKYHIYPDVLFCALLSAGEMGKAKCGPLTFERRAKIDKRIYYLVKEGSHVVAQFPVSKEFLERENNPIWNFMQNDLVRRCRREEHVKPKQPVYTHIEDLRVGARNVHLKAEVLKISKPVFVNSRYGDQVRLAKALLKDDTGEITLCLWREKVEAVSKGDLIEINNATVAKFRNEKQLTLSSKGSLRVIENMA